MPKMNSYATFDLYLAAQSTKNQAIIRILRAFMKRTLPKLDEAVKWGNGCWVKGNLPVAYVYSDKEWVQFGFTRGSALKDPLGLLEGDGAYVRHVKVRSVEDIDERAFRALALQAEKATLPIPRKPPAGARAKSVEKKSRKTGSKIRKKVARRA